VEDFIGRFYSGGYWKNEDATGSEREKSDYESDEDAGYLSTRGDLALFGKGEVLWKHLDETPTDHATIDEILQQVRM
jgi:hypothetical protein